VPIGNLTFAADGLVPLQTCSWIGANMSLTLLLQPFLLGNTVYTLPSNAQVGQLVMSGGVTAFTTGPFSIVSPFAKLTNSAGGPYFIQGSYDPSLRLVGESNLVIAHNFSVMKEVVFQGSNNVTIMGPNVALSASDFHCFTGSYNIIRLMWNSSCADPVANAFPQLFTNGLYCDVVDGNGHCVQSDFVINKKRSYTPLLYVIDTNGVSFTTNKTFAVLDYKTTPPTPANVSFVNTGGLTYAWDLVTFNVLIGGTNYTFASLYFYQTTPSPPSWHPCGSDCQQVQIAPGQVINTCDTHTNVTITQNVTINGDLTTVDLTIGSAASVTCGPGTSTTVTGKLAVQSGATLRFGDSAVAAIGSGQIDGKLDCGNLVTVTATQPVVLSSSNVLAITNRFVGSVLKGTSFTFGGSLQISVTTPLFQGATRDTITATQTVVVAQVTKRIVFFSSESFQSSGSSSGTFSSTTGTAVGYASASCDTVTTAPPVQSGSTLTVVVSTTRNPSAV
jgi:hypothetical protein